MDYIALREKPHQFLALSSLHVAELDDLLADFAPAWERLSLLAHAGRQPAEVCRPPRAA